MKSIQKRKHRAKSIKKRKHLAGVAPTGVAQTGVTRSTLMAAKKSEKFQRSPRRSAKSPKVSHRGVSKERRMRLSSMHSRLRLRQIKRHLQRWNTLEVNPWSLVCRWHSPTAAKPWETTCQRVVLNLPESTGQAQLSNLMVPGSTSQTPQTKSRT